jgi:hypothetical protein
MRCVKSEKYPQNKPESLWSNQKPLIDLDDQAPGGNRIWLWNMRASFASQTGTCWVCASTITVKNSNPALFGSTFKHKSKGQLFKVWWIVNTQRVRVLVCEVFCEWAGRRLGFCSFVCVVIVSSLHSCLERMLECKQELLSLHSLGKKLECKQASCLLHTYSALSLAENATMQARIMELALLEIS